MGWKIIEIEKPCILKTFNNNLMIFDIKKITISMSDIDVLIINNTLINLSVNAINELINNGVCVILCNAKQLPNSYILGYKVQKQSHINFEKQLQWTNEYKSKCWYWLLSNKINNQIDLLNYYNIDATEQKVLIRYENNEIRSIVEAQISSYFFKSLYGKGFNRNKDNLINTILNYGYVIITNMVARSIVKKGLNLGISFYHGSQYSSFPLAYDVVEIFRIIIDIFAKYLFDHNKLNGNNFSREIKSCLLDYIANYKIKIDDNYEFLNNAIDKVVDWIINNDFNNHNIIYDFGLELENNENYFQK